MTDTESHGDFFVEIRTSFRENPRLAFVFGGINADTSDSSTSDRPACMMRAMGVPSRQQNFPARS
jgi:hypothetical protein